MTKLETEIYEALDKVYSDTTQKEAKAAAEVAKRYIQKAYEDAFIKSAEYRKGAHAQYSFKSRVDWLKENGVI